MDALHTGRFVGIGMVARDGSGRSEAGNLWYRVTVTQWGVSHNFMCSKSVFESVPEQPGTMPFVCQSKQKPTASVGKGRTFVNELYEYELEAVGLQAAEIIIAMAAGVGGPSADPLAPTETGRRRQPA